EKSRYVMTGDGRIFHHNINDNTKDIRHSSFNSGEPVTSAGDMIIKEGKLIYIDNSSGHYKPSLERTLYIVKELESRGIDVSSVEIYDKVSRKTFTYSETLTEVSSRLERLSEYLSYVGEEYADALKSDLESLAFFNLLEGSTTDERLDIIEIWQVLYKTDLTSSDATSLQTLHRNLPKFKTQKGGATLTGLDVLWDVFTQQNALENIQNLNVVEKDYRFLKGLSYEFLPSGELRVTTGEVALAIVKDNWIADRSSLDAYSIFGKAGVAEHVYFGNAELIERMKAYRASSGKGVETIALEIYETGWEKWAASVLYSSILSIENKLQGISEHKLPQFTSTLDGIPDLDPGVREAFMKKILDLEDPPLIKTFLDDFAENEPAIRSFLDDPELVVSWGVWQQKLDNYAGEVYVNNGNKLLGRSGKTFENTKELEDEYKPGGIDWETFEKKVLYIEDDATRREYELFVNQEGKAVDHQGKLITTSNYGIYVLSKDGRIFFEEDPPLGKFHHSSFLAGEEVAAAGLVVIDDGVIQKMDNGSGHYQMPFTLVRENMKRELADRGLDVSTIRFTVRPEVYNNFQVKDNVLTIITDWNMSNIVGSLKGDGRQEYIPGLQGVTQVSVNGTTFDVAPGSVQIFLQGTKLVAVIPGFCFPAGTPIRLAGGITKAVEKIRKGDQVLSFDHLTKTRQLNSVTKLFKRTAHQLTRLAVSGTLLLATPEHQIFANGGYHEIQSLQAGDTLYDAKGGYYLVENVTTQDTTLTVYNFEVAKAHNYYVGELGLLAHNACNVPLIADKLQGVSDHKLPQFKSQLDAIADLEPDVRAAFTQKILELDDAQLIKTFLDD
ncbi:MAG: polymorphic toxin-type HINT domain-containing protein, partial [Bacteroidota bacterium]